MTREEAIQYNKNLKEYMSITDKKSEYKFLEENYIALDMAIKALEQNPCDDAISRQAVLELIADYDLSMGQVVKGIHALPSVNPQKIGHWIAVVDKWGDIITTVSGYKCSECGEFDSFRDKFCPNCGCRMVEPQERSE